MILSDFNHFTWPLSAMGKINWVMFVSTNDSSIYKKVKINPDIKPSYIMYIYIHLSKCKGKSDKSVPHCFTYLVHVLGSVIEGCDQFNTFFWFKSHFNKMLVKLCIHRKDCWPSETYFQCSIHNTGHSFHSMLFWRHWNNYQIVLGGKSEF